MDWRGVLPDMVVDLFRMSLLYIELRMVANVRDNIVNNGTELLR